MTDPLPAPMTPDDCDLRGLLFMPLDVLRLRDSDLSLVASGDEFKAAVLLWCASWHQMPAGSLPNENRALARLSGLSERAWAKAKTGALRGWVECSDGRLYHSVVAERVNHAWGERQKYRKKRDGDRERLATWRDKKQAGNGDETHDETRFETPKKRSEGEGEGKNSVSKETGGEPPKSPNDPDALAWSEAKRLLVAQGGMTKATAGSFFGKLLTEHGLTGRDLLGPIADGFGNGTGDPKSWLSAAAKTRSRKRVPPSRTPDLGYC